MLDSIAKRYVKAILQSWNFEQLEKLLKDLNLLQIACKTKDFQDAMHSPYLNFMQKQKMIFELVDSQDKQIHNLLSILLQNNRIEILPYIYDLIQQHIAFEKKVYHGDIYSKEELDEKIVASIQDKLARHFEVSLNLVQHRYEKDGISLKIEGLGVEISFSKERFFDDLKSYILKAI
ncbi:F0F1 ATP synthase subunit delta [Helicobacter anatolicus]|uniref:F0F1 ATP synthase subunit delta n=1 Tax=Helicobacter anatolicus TaxID=2905874 RepID=UPI001E5F6D6B|nr:F0F1 ATP synthase subunit delta [Helicobacter anatolicus]MCE3037846.1 F0F1 ATP synthase subunit delta [Helicobacter anatolicus]